MNNRCLYCYQSLDNNEIDFHASCSKKIFGMEEAPLVPYSAEDLLKMATQMIKSHETIPGVQPKLSLHFEKKSAQKTPDKYTIVGLWGAYILKPQSQIYPSLPEIEDLTMHLAEIANIKTVPHALIRLKSEQLAYITKRVDRINGSKMHMEDMCQLSERLTEQKYKGSYEQIGKLILKHASNPVFSVVNFFEQVVFSFLTGNNDMHLKNFSLLKKDNEHYHLCPAYDMVASELVVEGDDEELALNLNGKKKKLKKQDFMMAMKSVKLEDKSIENIFEKFAGAVALWHECIDNSFLPSALKEKYHQLIDHKIKQLYS